MTDSSQSSDQFKEMHSFMAMLQNLDVGLVVLDREYKIQLWNNFMESHSGLHPYEVREQVLFDAFPEINRDWFCHKAESVFQLNTRAFTTWEQRPYLFKFKNYRPITGSAQFMYQNITIIPLDSSVGVVEKIGIIVYDVTDVAVNRIELNAVNNELKRLSRTDKLTGLYNRGYWEDCLAKEFKRAQRTEQVSTLVMFDIDHFKKVNDKYGHPAGDAAIKNTADLLIMNMRETDVAGRYGGEEYTVLLIGTTAEQSMTFVERLRKSIEDSVVQYQDQKFKYTVSLGVAELTKNIKSHSEWIESADQALYQSKENGRNCATIYK
ncbi:GGDEF domain-containing protein [Catenovulum maritimum]|uniref:diguanylate cyclase n=1 Tax=Catenovulum maritimum TaxID=1513271 RepID=A0A0J8GUM6_9ALTE|nr:sensor domain-containing diguanylate cyclase [Catenovulum maritimum]KMT66452.1 diguanylate cyclase [Catenovulum maritimum]